MSSRRNRRPRHQSRSSRHHTAGALFPPDRLRRPQRATRRKTHSTTSCTRSCASLTGAEVLPFAALGGIRARRLASSLHFRHCTRDPPQWSPVSIAVDLFSAASSDPHVTKLSPWDLQRAHRQRAQLRPDASGMTARGQPSSIRRLCTQQATGPSQSPATQGRAHHCILSSKRGRAHSITLNSGPRRAQGSNVAVMGSTRRLKAMRLGSRCNLWSHGLRRLTIRAQGREGLTRSCGFEKPWPLIASQER